MNAQAPAYSPTVAKARAATWAQRWAPDFAVALLIAASIAAFHGRFIIAQRFSLDTSDVFEYTLWGAFMMAILGCGRVVYRLSQHARKRRRRYGESLRDDDTGSLSVEFLLTFPWMYIMFGMVIQWGLIARAKIVVDYAAYRAARSAVTQVESKTWGPLYSLNLLEPDGIPINRQRRVREAAALILAQLSPYHTSDDPNRGAWTSYGYGSNRTAAIAMAEAGNPKWPYAMKTSAYERRAAWALNALSSSQQGGMGFQLDLEMSPLINVDFTQFGYVAGNYFDVLENMLNEYADVLNQYDVSPDQTGFLGIKIPMPWPIPDIKIGIDLGDNSGTISDMLGIPSPSDIADQIVSEILDPVRAAIINPIMDMTNSLDDMLSDIDPGNPLIPREARIQIRYPYQLRVPMVAQLVHPLWETKSGFRGRFIQIEADVSMQTTGGRAGNPLTLISGSPIP